MWQSVLDAYRERIVDSGRQPLFLLLVGLIGAFLFIRFSVRMIRRGTSWWPGNVSPGGLHIHHVVFGQTLMVIAGVGSFAFRGNSEIPWDVLGLAFGIGCGLVLDEFALVLHLEDVYWKEQGRTSVDAVIMAAALIGLLLVGEVPFGGFNRQLTAGQLVGAGVLVLLIVVSLLKGKIWTGLIGVMVPLLPVIGAIRLARPNSPWARWRYRSRPKRLARAERREARIHQRVVTFKTSAYNVVAGAPDRPPVSPAPAPRTVPPPTPTPTPLPEPAPEPPQPPARWRLRCASAAEWYMRAAAVLNLLAAPIAPFRQRVQRVDSGDYFTPVLLSAGFTAALFAGLLAVMLRRRKRAAWITATVVAGAFAALYVLALAADPQDRSHPFNWVSAVITLALLAVLLAARPVYRVRGGRGNVLFGLGVLICGAAVLTALGALLVRLTAPAPEPGWGAGFGYALLRLFTVSGVAADTDIDAAGWVDLTLNILGAALFLLVVRVLFRSPRGELRLGTQDEQRLRALLERHGGRDSLGYFALRRDKAVCWSPSGKAAVLHRVVFGVALASGDPIGDPEAWPQAIEVWRARARANAWVPAVTGASELGGTAYARAGLKALEYGDEAVVETAGFKLEGRAMRSLRQTYDRVGEAGYRAVLRRHRDIPRAELDELVHLADAWRHGRTERGFSMALGRLGDPADGDCLMLECRDENDRTCALLSFVPWGPDGLSLDLMRRDRDSDNGLVEYLVTELLLRAASGALPVAQVSLNFAMFRSVFERGSRIGAGPVLRIWRAVLLFLSHWWQLESLYRANARYQPQWRPRFLLYEKSTELFAIAAANAAAEGFVTRPRLRRSQGPGGGSDPRDARGQGDRGDRGD
ncbi:phosphatidylglycerol lysyltransferase domain-containing protein [Kitasatospora sp. NBC_00315]|uniref:phosphatidylglycerol lysyltransferase domain-containing protein n=1 Tax=Kitasatospora sp. NBC_00315 TaxID=2975963 RepID=UPI0032508F6C